MVIKMESDKENLNLSVSIDGGDNPFTAYVDETKDLILSGNAFEEKHSDGKTGVEFYGRLRAVSSGGTIKCGSKDILIEMQKKLYCIWPWKPSLSKPMLLKNAGKELIMPRHIPMKTCLRSIQKTLNPCLTALSCILQKKKIFQPTFFWIKSEMVM